MGKKFLNEFNRALLIFLLKNKLYRANVIFFNENGTKKPFCLKHSLTAEGVLRSLRESQQRGDQLLRQAPFEPSLLRG